MAAGREGLSTADRTALDDAGGRLRQALADLAKAAPLLGEVGKRLSIAWAGFLALSAKDLDQHEYTSIIENAHHYTAKAKAKARLTPNEVDTLRGTLFRRMFWETRAGRPEGEGRTPAMLAEMDYCYGRLVRALPLLASRFGLEKESRGWAADAFNGGGFWYEFHQRAEEAMKESDNPHGIKASAAFAAAMESDPKTKAAWERARAKLQAFGKALQEAMNSPEYRAAQAAERRKWQDLAEAIREGLRASGEQLAAQGFTPPATVEDWEHLARIVEIPLETIRRGDLTAREIHACALAWADRQKLKGKLSASANAATSTKPPAPAAKPQDDESADAGGPVEDPHDNRKAVWAGKRIYLGNDTQISRLFWLLAKPVGRAASMAEVQRAVDGMETDRDGKPDDVRKAAQRIRKAISELKAALREAKLDDHVLIAKGGPQAAPEYTMVWRWAK